MPPSSPSALEKALALLDAIGADRGKISISTLAARLGMPAATAHRMVATFERQGYLQRAGRGRYLIGYGLTALIAPDSERRLIEAAGAPIVRALARQTGLAAHLGVLENDMVTYLVKSGRDSADIFTKAGMQLEAYCSGIGKALLAHLPDEERERYLAGGPFIRLTPNTIIDPNALRDELAHVRRRGYAIDDAEISESLRCIAMPIRRADGYAVAAMSLSARARRGPERQLETHHATLARAIGDVEAALKLRRTPQEAETALDPITA